MRAQASFVVVVLAVAGLTVPPAHADDSAIDAAFGIAGWQRSFVLLGGATNERMVAAARTPDGGYLLAGSRTGGGFGVSIFLAKFRPDGSYDSGFGGTGATGNAGSGRVLKDASLSSVNDMTVDTQGRIIVVGKSTGALGQSDFGVVRFKPDGTDDTSFADHGRAVIAIDRDPSHNRVDDIPNSVTTLPDGSLFVAGVVDEVSGTPTRVVALAKLKPDGSPDATFSMSYGPGVAEYCRANCVDVISVARVVYDAPRNRIVIGGSYTTAPLDWDWFLITRDLSSTTSATFTIPIVFGGTSGYDVGYMTNVVMQPDGKPLLVGYTNIETLATRPVVLRRQASGAADDTDFGNTSGRGIYLGGTNAVLYNDAAVDSLGRIIVAGQSLFPLGLVQRLSPTGVPDTSFNSGSSQATYLAPTSGSPSHSTSFKRLFLDAGRPVLAGEAPWSTSVDTDYDLVITRLQTDLIFANGFE